PGSQPRGGAVGRRERRRGPRRNVAQRGGRKGISVGGAPDSRQFGVDRRGESRSRLIFPTIREDDGASAISDLDAGGERKHVHNNHHVVAGGEMSNSVLAPFASHIEAGLIECHADRPPIDSTDSEESQSKSSAPSPIIEASSSTVCRRPVFHRSISVSPALRVAHQRTPNRVFRYSRICDSKAEALRKSAE